MGKYAALKADDVEEPPGMQAEEKWLAFLILETGLLLIFQVLVGSWGSSVALIADSAHSFVDLVGYGINLYAEHLKKSHDSNSLVTEEVVDLIGCILSTLMLVAGTGWAAKESLARLLHDTSKGSDFSRVGPALLAFAVVSTTAHVIALVVYACNCFRSARDDESLVELGMMPQKQSLRLAPILFDEASISTVPEEPGQDEPAAAPPSLPLPTAPPPPSAPSSPQPLLSLLQPTSPIDSKASPPPGVPRESFGRQRDRRRKARPVQVKTLNLRNDFSMPDASPDNAGGPCVVNGCQSDACRLPGSSAAGRSDIEDVLHRIMHPGCQSSHVNVRSGRIEGSATDNLNVTSAKLHVIADLLRGVTILVVALLIQARKITCPGTADAVCALFVAFLVLLGSIELIRQACSYCWRNANELGTAISPAESYL